MKQKYFQNNLSSETQKYLIYLILNKITWNLTSWDLNTKRIKYLVPKKIFDIKIYLIYQYLHPIKSIAIPRSILVCTRYPGRRVGVNDRCAQSVSLQGQMSHTKHRRYASPSSAFFSTIIGKDCIKDKSDVWRPWIHNKILRHLEPWWCVGGWHRPRYTFSRYNHSCIIYEQIHFRFDVTPTRTM